MNLHNEWFNEKRISLQIGNYYGTVEVTIISDEYYIQIMDWNDEYNRLKINKEVYEYFKNIMSNECSSK